ncbi:MAG: fibrobacter succinogenes major paralogous domain-containing protein, partial [Patescibacteria group bacterium]|nr:fibrobacter succinogenes major paralogous domain-containing protein [Patescibacteria group bacterium]
MFIKNKRKRILTELFIMSLSILFLTSVVAYNEEEIYADDPTTKICYSDNETNCDTYGALYTWSMVMDLDSSCDTTDCSAQIETPHQGICPEGWHVPTDADFKELEMAVGMSEAQADSLGWRGSPAGSKLAGDEDLWGPTRTIVTTNGFEDSGFMGLPAGYRSTDGSSFYNLNVNTNWWS